MKKLIRAIKLKLKLLKLKIIKLKLLNSVVPGFHLMLFLYLQQNYHYSSGCDPGMVSQCAKKKLVPQKVA